MYFFNVKKFLIAICKISLKIRCLIEFVCHMPEKNLSKISPSILPPPKYLVNESLACYSWRLLYAKLMSIHNVNVVKPPHYSITSKLTKICQHFHERERHGFSGDVFLWLMFKFIIHFHCSNFGMYVLYTYGLLDVDLSKWSAINDFAYHSFSFAEILCWEKKNQ